MTKRELMQELTAELEAKQINRLDEINANCNKDAIQNAIDCLRCSDETMADYLTIVKLKYPGIYNTIIQSNYLKHPFNRLFVYNTARQVIAE